MIAEFLKQFYKDLDKLPSQSIKNDVISAIENVEAATKTTGIKNLKKIDRIQIRLQDKN